MTRPHGTTRQLCAMLALTGALTSSGCASSGATSDYGSVRKLVQARSELQLPASPAAHDEDVSADARALLQAPLSAQSAERIALLQNPALRAELQELGIARGQLAQASVLPNPEVEVEMRVPTSGGGGTEWGLGLAIPLAPLILHGARSDAAEAELDAARFRAAGAVLDLGLRVRLAYYALLASQAHVQIVRSEVASFAVAYEAARALHDAGNVTDLDLLTQQAAYEGARMAVAEAEAAARGEHERLHVLLGLSASMHWQADGALMHVPLDVALDPESERKALDASLELAQTKAQIAAFDGRASLAQSSGWLSSLEVGVAGEYQESEWSVGPKLSGALPLFDRGRGTATTERARAVQLEHRFLAIAADVRAAVRTAIDGLQTAAERARHCRDVLVPLRKQVVKETLLQYNAMQVGVFQLLEAKRTELDSEHACVDAQLAYWTKRAELDALLAGKLTQPSAAASTAAAASALPQASSGAH